MRIYEISFIENNNKVIILENLDVFIHGMGIAIDVYNNEIKREGDILYIPYWIYYDYYWDRLRAGFVNTKDFIERKNGKSQNIFLKQIYSFDDEPIIEEEWEYIIYYGVDNKLELRPYTIPFW